MALSWYVVHTLTNYEEKVKQELEKQISNLGLASQFGRILLPTEEVVEIKKSKRVTKRRKYFPGYLFVEMEINNNTFWLVRNTTGVSGFLGGLKPIALQTEEAKHIIELVESPSAKPKPSIVFEKEEQVRIIEGPFANFIGVIEDINEEKGKLKVMVSIFGRLTPVELNFLQVEKI